MKYLKKIKLSICIATMNRAYYLKQLLDMIITQYQDNVELVIVDGASKDDTYDVIVAAQRKISNIQYIRLEEKGGVDRDFSHAVNKAKGEFCWLLPDDDLIKPEAIKNILLMINKNTNLIIINAEIWSKEMDFLLSSQTVKIKKNKEYNRNNFSNFFISLSTHISFIGSVVIRKSVWNKRQKQKYFGSWFVHVGVIFQDVLDGIKVMADPMVMIRYGNASWSTKSFEITLFKWPELIWSFNLFNDSIKKKIVSQFPWQSLARIALFKARGAFSIREYNLFIKDKITLHKKILFWTILFVPSIVFNILFLIYFNIFRWKYKDWKLHIYDLKNSISYYK